MHPNRKAIIKARKMAVKRMEEAQGISEECKHGAAVCEPCAEERDRHLDVL